MYRELYIVATPIGNLEDITLRAIEVLRQVDWIAAEDTRHSKRLLTHYGISTRLLSLHEHNEAARVNEILNLLEKGQSVAVISDAGTPLVNDPGYPLVAKAQELGVRVVPIPGPCSAITALCAAGLPTDRFAFEGFLPAKGEKRSKRLQALQHEPRTMIFFESVHRIENLLEEMVAAFGQDRLACVARELTKTYETIKRAPLGELLSWVNSDSNQRKGEFVVVVAGNSEPVEVDFAKIDPVLQPLLAELPLKQAVKLAQSITGIGRSKIYQRALTLKS